MVVACTDRQRQGAVAQALVLHAQTQLRRAPVDQIAMQSHFRAKHILAERIPRQSQPVLQGAQVQTLARHRKLEPIAHRQCRALHIQTVIAAIDVGGERHGAEFIARAVPRQRGPGHDAAATAAFEHRDAAGGQQPALARHAQQWVQRRCGKQHCGRCRTWNALHR